MRHFCKISVDNGVQIDQLFQRALVVHKTEQLLRKNEAVTMSKHERLLSKKMFGTMKLSSYFQRINL